MSAITLPRLVGTRQAADQIVQESRLTPGDDVTIYARAVSSAAPSFADELLKQLRHHGVRKIRVVGSESRLFTYLSESAGRLGGIEVVRSSSERQAS